MLSFNNFKSKSMQKINDKISRMQIKAGSNFPPGCPAIPQGSGNVPGTSSSAQLCGPALLGPQPYWSCLPHPSPVGPAQGEFRNWKLRMKPFPLSLNSPNSGGKENQTRESSSRDKSWADKSHKAYIQNCILVTTFPNP